MRTLALAVAMSVCLGSSAAHAVCTTGAECIRERFGSDATLRNNRIIDRTDRLGDRGRPLNPYVAGQNVANQARRAGRFDSTLDAAAGRRSTSDQLRPGEVRPDVRYTPGAQTDPYSQGPLVPGMAPSALENEPELTVERFNPVEPVTGEPGAAGTEGRAVPPGRPAAPVRRDRNAPQGAAELRYGGPKTSGAYR